MADSLMDRTFQEYPRLRDYGVQFMDSSKDGINNGRLMETYPADERDNPMPGKPTIQIFDPKTTPQDIMGEHLHLLKNSDPNVKSTRQSFIDSMTPEQNQKLLEQYKYAIQNFGEDRPFDQWKDMSGHDAWVRGYITGQWPKDIYTPEQTQLFDSLDQYLRKQ